jgi:hypothetical protein
MIVLSWVNGLCRVGRGFVKDDSVSAFLRWQLLLATIPGLKPDQLPVIVISYGRDRLTRFTIERVIGPNCFPNAGLKVLLLGPTMSFVLTMRS